MGPWRPYKVHLSGTVKMYFFLDFRAFSDLAKQADPWRAVAPWGFYRNTDFSSCSGFIIEIRGDFLFIFCLDFCIFKGLYVLFFKVKLSSPISKAGWFLWKPFQTEYPLKCHWWLKIQPDLFFSNEHASSGARGLEQLIRMWKCHPGSSCCVPGPHLNFCPHQGQPLRQGLRQAAAPASQFFKPVLQSCSLLRGK